MRVVALDPALSVTGVADTALPKPFTISPPSGLTGPGRLYWIQKRILQAVEGADLVAIEGYAYGRENQAHQLGELGGVIRLAVWCRNIPVVEIPPSIRMKVATGKGLAKKEHVLAEAIHRLGYQGHDNNEADALWILQRVLQHYGLPGAVTLPKTHLEYTAKSKVAWPTLEQLQRRRAS